MKKFFIELFAMCVTSVALATDWIYDSESGTVSDGVWTFSATVQGESISIKGYTGYPETISPLDFSKPVKSQDGETSYTIVSLDPKFGGYSSLNGDGGNYVGEITLPGEGLTTAFGSYGFAYCVNASGDIVLPDSLSSVAGGGFYHAKITSVTFGRSTLTLALGWFPWFQGCTSLTNVVIPAGASISIGDFAFFQGCSNLKDLDLSGVVSIDNNKAGYPHLSGCGSLTNVTFGANLTLLDSEFFSGNSRLARVEFLGAPPATFSMPYLNEIANDQTVATIIPADKKSEWAEYVVDPTFPGEKTTWKAAYLRDGCDPSKRPVYTTAWHPRVITGWTYNGSSISYGGWTFTAKASGTNITISACTSDPGPDAVLDFSLPVQDEDNDYVILTNNANFYSYANKLNLKTLILPASGKMIIESDAFRGCANLTGDLYFTGVSEIDNHAFRDDTGITSVKFGPGVKSVKGYVFNGCTSLTNVVFDKNGSTDLGAGNSTFSDCTALEYVDLSGVSDLHCSSWTQPLFSNCSSIKSIIMKSPLRTDRYPFYNHRSSTVFHFYGAAPVLVMNMFDLGTTGGNSYVHLNPRDPDYASQLASWAPMTAGGQLNESSVWNSTLFDNNAGGGRPLILVHPKPGFVIVVR